MPPPIIRTRCPPSDLASLVQIHTVLARVYASRVHDVREPELTWAALPSPTRFGDPFKVAERLA